MHIPVCLSVFLLLFVCCFCCLLLVVGCYCLFVVVSCGLLFVCLLLLVVVVLGFTMLLTSQVISIVSYSEREKSDKFCSEALFRLEVLLRAINLWHGTHGITSLPKEVILWIFTLWKNPSSPAGFEPANLGSSGEYDNHGTTGVDAQVESCTRFIMNMTTPTSHSTDVDTLIMINSLQSPMNVYQRHILHAVPWCWYIPPCIRSL